MLAGILTKIESPVCGKLDRQINVNSSREVKIAAF